MTDIYIYSQIGQGGITAESIRKKLANADDEVTIHINSPGGEVYEGYTIYNIIRNSGKKVTVVIEGLCASIATLIACAGDRIVMNPTAEFMIHNPMVGIEGDAEDLRKVASQLDNIKQTIIQAYKRKTNKSEQELWDMMDKETFLSAGQAKEYGFVDEVEQAFKVVAYFDITKIKQERKMEDKINDFFKAFENKIEALTKKWKPKNLNATLADGTKIFIETEDEILEGKAVFIETPEGNKPAPDGDHKLADGRVITVKGGIIESVSEGTIEDEKKKPTEEELMNQIAALQNQLTDRDTLIENQKNEIATMKTDSETIKAEVVNLKNDFAKIKNTALGTDPTKKPVNFSEKTDNEFLNAILKKVKDRN